MVPTLDGKLLLGPSEQPGVGPLSATTEAGLAKLRQLAAQVAPELDLELTIRSFAGVRPKPYNVVRAQSIHDFTVTNPARGLWSLIGIKTPGLTCAQALGAWLAPRWRTSWGRGNWTPPSGRSEKRRYGPAS